ncbi:MAG: hypothetical protein O4861_05155 [Trichodesmium sp. St16_bin4-tuft]|nr:hypothetical protein [Trichodesmium sp. MAG_R01]MDE5070202.1 hypothetical protein [Trichodesmium sp. St4_bin8_1]MDE5072552.1 hypothetical protein [Trichodesmium sp. St5_bin8]MDE5077563.1 hypothetical protein [Trichodesmium sp. St2_bin6]MDE5097754.1 hypothetical protein [Trichodesmium sp. St16_bin4-tuft]MDE5103106.1 hypothetical protein [Trichodesmium sp. St19_bin2]
MSSIFSFYLYHRYQLLLLFTKRQVYSTKTDFTYSNKGKIFRSEEIEKAVILTNITVITLAMIFKQVVGIGLFEVIDKKQTRVFIGGIKLVLFDFSNTIPKAGVARTKSICVTKKTARNKLINN